ncbi:MAG: hypothetical protein QOE72_989 [Chloroflexota bacterium]|nr:hypothetical protein [Chloroflexota bacterium]
MVAAAGVGAAVGAGVALICAVGDGEALATPGLESFPATRLKITPTATSPATTTARTATASAVRERGVGVPTLILDPPRATARPGARDR